MHRPANIFKYLILPVLIVTSAQAQMVDTPAKRAELYQDCTALTQSQPETALTQALDWRDRGGGVMARHCISLAFSALGQYDQAAQRLEKVAEDIKAGRGLDDLGPAVREAAELISDFYAQAGNAWLLAGDPVKAYSAFSQGLAEAGGDLNPVVMELLVDRARALGEAGDYAAALEDLERARLMAPDRADIYVYRASAFRFLGDYAAAAAELENALSLKADDEFALLERGNLRSLRGDRDGAREDWQKILMLYPSSSSAAAARTNIERMDVSQDTTDGDDPQ